MNTICYNTQFHAEVSEYINKYRLDADTTLPYDCQFCGPIYTKYKQNKRAIDSLIEQYRIILSGLSEVEILQIILCYSNECFFTTTKNLVRISLQDQADILKTQRFNDVLLKYELLNYCSMPLGQKRRNIYRYFREFFKMNLSEVNSLLYDLLRRSDIQIYKNYIEVNVKRPEEKFRYLLETYYIPDQWLKDIFGLSDEHLDYFNANFKRGFESPQKMIRDSSLSVHLKRQFTSYVADKVCVIDEKRILSTKVDIIKVLLEGYGNDEMDMVGLYADYELVTESAPNSDELGFATLNDFEAFIEKLPFVIWTSDHYFRYCDLTVADIHFIISKIDFEKYNNSEIPVELLYKDNRTLLEKFGILDYSEFYYFLSQNKACIKKFIVDFRRDFIIFIGTVEKKDAIPPVKPKAPDILSDEEVEKLNVLLEEPIYSFKKAKNLIQSVVGGKLGYKATFGNLRLLGYERVGNIVRSREFESIEDAVKAYLEKFEVLNFEREDKDLLNHEKVKTVLKDVQYKFKIIEFAPESFISMEKLGSEGITKKRIFDYIDAVEAFTAGNCFTTAWLRKENFENPFEALGFDNYFYDSIFKYSWRFKYTAIGNTFVFCRGEEPVTLAGIIEEIVNPLKVIDIHDLIETLHHNFGVDVSEKQLIMAIKKKQNTELHYCEIKEKIYKNYDIYLDNID